MLIIPAIDLQGGVAVRLLRGAFDAATSYGDPTTALRSFANAGAIWVHIVDLDGAKARAPAQHDLISHLAREFDINVQCGGGVRLREHVDALLANGVRRVVVGSVAVQRPEETRSWIAEFGAERICVAVDVRSAQRGWEVVTDGWTRDAGLTIEKALDEFARSGLRHVLVTDISRDGALGGPNTALIADLTADWPGLAIQASGGVSSIGDLRAVKTAGASAVIIGRALYERRFALEDALAL